MSLKSMTPLTTSTQEPSDLVKASPSLMELWESGQIPHAELERRALGAQRLKELYSSDPYYARRAEKDPDYWHGFYASRINS